MATKGWKAFEAMLRRKGNTQTYEDMLAETQNMNTLSKEHAEELIKELREEPDYSIMTENGELVHITMEERIENVKRRIRI